ncbi:MAG: hypothetical protein ACRCUT_05505, partial [Spirochaetota bacterium]
MRTSHIKFYAAAFTLLFTAVSVQASQLVITAPTLGGSGAATAQPSLNDAVFDIQNTLNADSFSMFTKQEDLARGF